MSRSRPARAVLSMVSVAALMIAGLSWTEPAAADGTKPDVKQVEFTVDGNKVDTNPADVWKGFGALTCNNTSRYLLDYKEEHPAQYWKIMNDLFNPRTGMGMSHVKIEMGSDANTSSGTEPATKRTEDEVANVLRGAGFHFAADAKSINPNVEISLLRWSEPAWANTSEKLYQWYKQTIDAAFDTYGLVVNWVSPNKNETAADVAGITYFAQRLNEDAQKPGATRYDYSKIKIASSDEVGGTGMADDLVTLVSPGSLSDAQRADARVPSADRDAALREAIDPSNKDILWAVSYPQYDDGVATYYYRIKNQPYLGLVDGLTHHYDTTTSPAMAILNRTYGLEIWYSEGVAGIGSGRALQNADLVGSGETALDVANLFINGYNNAGADLGPNGYPSRVKDAHHSLYVFQPSIGAFPQGTTYSSKQNLGAYDPWSGWYEREAGFFVTRQFTNFAKPGTWRYVESGASYGGGRQSGHSIVDSYSNYLTLTAPDLSDFSMVLNNHSNETVHYKVNVKNMHLDRRPRLAGYETQLRNGRFFDSNWFQRLPNLNITRQNADGSFTVDFTVQPQSIRTVTTLPERQLPTAHRPGDQTFTTNGREVLDQRARGDHTIYSDDFEYAGYPAAATRRGGPKLSYLERRGDTPRYTNDMSGAFEVNAEADGDHRLVQQLTYNQIPTGWAYGGHGKPETLLGDDRWANYTVSTDINFDRTTPVKAEYPNYIGVGGRANQEGNGYLFLLLPNGAWGIVQDAGDASSIAPAMTADNTLARGTVAGFDPTVVHKVSVTMAGTTVRAVVDGHEVGTWTDPDGGNLRMSGRLHAVSGWYHNTFDNLQVTDVRGYPATLTEYVDDGDSRLTYSGDVTRYLVGSSALNRSATGLKADGSVELTFVGTGILLEGDGSKSGTADVDIDGRRVATGAPVTTARARNVGFYLTGLRYGAHTVRITSRDDGVRLDSIGVYGKTAAGGGTAALAATVKRYGCLNLPARFEETL